MKRVCPAAGVRARDRAVIASLGISGRTLMEIAGRGAARHLQARYPAGPAAVLCGPGNNGGDGYVVARWLALAGREVRLWAARPPASEDARANADLCARMGLVLANTPEDALRGAAVAVDALLGTGQDQAPRGAIRQAIQALRAAPATPVVALDMPTGVCADTGRILGASPGEEAVQAELTVTFGHHKQGLLCEPGASLAGEVVLIDIGLDLADHAGLPPDDTPDAWLLEAGDIAAFWEAAGLGGRAGEGQAKWDRGHVAVRAGGGAAVLAAHGAFRAGAGMVTVLAPRAEWPALHGLWPEVILAEPDRLDPGRHDVLVIGPGLGTADEPAREVRGCWARWPNPLLADADALTVLGAAPPAPEAEGGAARVATPHVAEAGRLLGLPRAAVEADRFQAARRLQAWLPPGGAAVLKGPHSLVASAEGTWASPIRCGRLATAGSGDVLSGLIGGLLARGLPPARAAAVGTWWHGHAGLQMPARGTASDLLERLRSDSPGG